MASPDALLAHVAPFLAAPERAAILTDFDGTLAPIVPEPADARPVAGAVDVLGALAGRYGRVAVISGRPVAFLAEQLGAAIGAGVLVSGLYGLERIERGAVATHPDAEVWRTPVEEAASAAEVAAPPGVIVERKGLSVTVHVRTAPDQDAWAREWVTARAASSGLALHEARMSYELRPPVRIDKGTIVADLTEGMDAACFLGDDVGDLPAFDALARARTRGVHTVCIGVQSPEAPAALVTGADVLVDGPEGGLAFLKRLLPS